MRTSAQPDRPPHGLAPVVVRLDAVAVHAGPRRLLEVPSLVISAGERVAVVGANGAGKSTLLRTIAGTTVPTDGQVEVLGRRIDRDAAAPLSARGRRALRAEIGQLLQGLHLVARLSALENVVIGALGRRDALPAWRGWLRLYPAALRAQAQAVLDQLGLGSHTHTRSDRLSGGEKQKVALGRLLMQRPRLILADEPTAALDPASTRQVLELLRQAAEGRTLVSVVHQPDLLPLLADRVIGVSAGRVAFDLPREAVSAQVLESLYRADGPLGTAHTEVAPPNHRAAPWPALHSR